MREETRTYYVHKIGFVKGKITEIGEEMPRTYDRNRESEEVKFVIGSVIPDWGKYNYGQKDSARGILRIRLPRALYHSVNESLRNSGAQSKPVRELDGQVYAYVDDAKSATSKEIAKEFDVDLPTVTGSLRVLYNKGLVGKKRENLIRFTWFLIEEQD